MQNFEQDFWLVFLLKFDEIFKIFADFENFSGKTASNQFWDGLNLDFQEFPAKNLRRLMGMLIKLKKIGSWA